jgi:hypothetical protein
VGQGVGWGPQGSLPDPAHLCHICEKSRFQDVKPTLLHIQAVTNRRVKARMLPIGPGGLQSGFSILRYVRRGFLKKKSGPRTPRPPGGPPVLGSLVWRGGGFGGWSCTSAATRGQRALLRFFISSTLVKRAVPRPSGAAALLPKAWPGWLS